VGRDAEGKRWRETEEVDEWFACAALLVVVMMMMEILRFCDVSLFREARDTLLLADTLIDDYDGQFMRWK